jgi:hypothetical protein
MPNTIPAAGEAMPKTTRRAFLAGVAVISVPSAATACEVVITSQDVPTGMSVLIAKHKAAIELDKAAWEGVSDLDDILPERPTAKVQTARTYQGRNNNGVEVFSPSFSWTEEDIRRVYERHDNWAPGRMFHGPQSWVAEKRAQHYQQMEEKIRELQTIKAERQRIEDEFGYTAALTEARRLSDIVKGIEAEIITYVPKTFQEAIDKANWCVWAAEDDYCYLYDGDNLSGVLADALAAIGRAAS